MNPELNIIGRTTCLQGDALIVVGHDDGASEVNFVVRNHDTEPGNFSPRTGSTGHELAEFILRVMGHWEKTTDGSLAGIPMPQISFRTVERAPVEVFPHFRNCLQKYRI